MSGQTSVPPIAFTDNGYVPPPQSGLVTGLQADWQAALGSNLNVIAAGSYMPPAGQLITSEAAVIGDQNDAFCWLANGVDPAYASGRLQDAIGRLSPGGGFARIASKPTILQITNAGGVGAVLPAGLTVQDQNSNLYALTTAVTIAATGSVVGQFAATLNGPIPVPGSVSIYQSYPQWDSVSVNSGVQGQNTESRSAFESRRNAALYANSRAQVQAVTGNIWATVPGVVSVYGYSNNTASPVTVQGVTIAANEGYVAVVGGAGTAVAQAIWEKWPPGTAMYAGNTSQTVYDTSEGYNPPYPAYTVTWEIPPDLTVFWAVQIKNGPAVPSNAGTLVASAISTGMANGTTLATGQQITPPASIGGMVFALPFAAVIAGLGSWAIPVSVLIGSANTAAATFTAAMSGTIMTTSTVSSGTIAVGQAVVASGVADGTFITGTVTGTSWAIGIGQTVTSEAMASITMNLTEITPNINQYPASTTLDVVVTLV